MKAHLIIGACASAFITLAACDKANVADSAPVPQQTASAEAPAPAPVDVDAQVRQAQDFVNAAGQANLVEIQTAQLALQKGASADVKKFAQELIDDHKAANESLKAAATAAALAPPPETLDDFHMRRINDLTEPQSASSFDHDFMALQVDAHSDAIDLLKDYAQDGKIAQIKTYAEQTLPTVERNKTQAESVEKQVKDSPAKSSG